MKYRLVVFLITFITQVHFLFAQNYRLLSLNFKPMFGTSVLQMKDSSYKLTENNSIKFETLKFYISVIEFWGNSEPVWVEPNSFHLMDASDSTTLKLVFKIPADIVFSKIKFKLGIDSTTNVSGALGGDLDPTKGMYWTWQSGYINFKLEGKSPYCKTQNNEFQFHLGGYQQPFYALQTLCFCINSSEQINLKLDVQEILKQIDLAKINHIMSPNVEAVLLSKIVANAFKVSEN